MFCENCGREIKEGWRVCPNCGIQLHIKGIGEERQCEAERNSEMKKKKSKPLKKIGFGLLAIIAVLIIINVINGTGGDSTLESQMEDENVKVHTMEEVGGYTQWQEDGYPGKVRTSIIFKLPLVDRKANNYCVQITTTLGELIFIQQKDESMFSEWDWLDDARKITSENKGELEYVSYKATLSLAGYTEVDNKIYPRFWIEDIEESSCY